MPNKPSSDGSRNLSLEALFRSVVERLLRTESPRILLTRDGPDNWVPRALLPPSADIIELPGGSQLR